MSVTLVLNCVCVFMYVSVCVYLLGDIIQPSTHSKRDFVGVISLRIFSWGYCSGAQWNHTDTHIYIQTYIYIYKIVQFFIALLGSSMSLYNVCLIYVSVSKESMLNSLATYVDLSVSLYQYANITVYILRLYC